MAKGNKGTPKQISGKGKPTIAGLPAHALVKGKATLAGQPLPGNSPVARKTQNPKNWTNTHPIPGGAPPAAKAKGKPGY